MHGKILSTIGDNFTIIGEDNVLYNAFSKGILRFKKMNLFVGDNVEFDDKSLIITNVLARNNELIRPRIANIDQLIIVMSVKEPIISSYLLYKYLSYANYYKIKSIVIFTKVDNQDDYNSVGKLSTELASIGIQPLFHSNNKKYSNFTLDNLLKDKTSALLGQTGSGKSSLINDLDDNFTRTVGDYSACLGRGKHTTKEVILLPYLNGYVADTPGFSSLDLDFYKEDLAKCFPGFFNLGNCNYSDCLHLSEKNCVIKAAVDKGYISKEQYEIYLKLLSELKARREKYL